jgi:hypothetical protein
MSLQILPHMQLVNIKLTKKKILEVFYAGLKDEPYKMYIDPKVKMAFMYLDDCLRGTIEFLEASNFSLSRRVYNFHGFTTTPDELVKEIKK